MPSVDVTSDPKTELRTKLLRRLIWKVPLILLLVSFAVWWQWKKEEEKQAEPGVQNTASKAESFAGSWIGEVTYPWEAKYTEPFFFQPEGDKLFGTASFLGAKRGIEEGKIQGESISFFVRFEEYSSGATSQHKNYYWGKLNGKAILLRMQDDRGDPAVEWVLNKNAPTQ